jgi:hypothetical protein
VKRSESEVMFSWLQTRRPEHSAARQRYLLGEGTLEKSARSHTSDMTYIHAFPRGTSPRYKNHAVWAITNDRPTHLDDDHPQREIFHMLTDKRHTLFRFRCFPIQLGSKAAGRATPDLQALKGMCTWAASRGVLLKKKYSVVKDPVGAPLERYYSDRPFDGSSQYQGVAS